MALILASRIPSGKRNAGRCTSLSLADDQIPSFIDADELHFARPRAGEWTNQKIAENFNILIDLFFNLPRNVVIAGDGEFLLRYTKHPASANPPYAKRGRSVVHREPASDREALTDQLWVLMARLLSSFTRGGLRQGTERRHEKKQQCRSMNQRTPALRPARSVMTSQEPH
jgi:hypothetical protein